MSSDRQNPYASPSALADPQALRRVPIDAVPISDPPLGVINVVEQAAKPPRVWRMAFAPDGAWLYIPEETSAFVLTHAELAEHANIMPWGAFLMVALRGLVPDGRAIGFKIEGDAIGVFRRWAMSKRDVLLQPILKKRLRFSLPLGLFIAATSLPLFGPSFDPFALVFGAGLVVLSLVASRFPKPVLFAIEAALWFSLAASHGVSVYRGSTWSIMFVFFCLLIGRQSLKTFRFYR